MITTILINENNGNALPCDEETDHDECSDGSAQCDPKSTTCNNLIPDYECKCKPGYIVINNDKYKCKGNCLFMVSLTHCQQCI